LDVVLLVLLGVFPELHPKEELAAQVEQRRQLTWQQPRVFAREVAKEFDFAQHGIEGSVVEGEDLGRKGSIREVAEALEASPQQGGDLVKPLQQPGGGSAGKTVVDRLAGERHPLIVPEAV